MIPRLKPNIGFRELFNALHFSKKDDIHNFEKSFSKITHQKYSLAFPYGRTALMLLINALGLKDNEIICPAYTCVVVAHAIVYSGNKPIFVDCAFSEFNMDLDLVEEAITEKTGAIIVTSLFGYPVNLDHLDRIRERHPEIMIIQDCAHSFMAEFKGRYVQREGVASIFGLNISKMSTSIFGGVVNTDNEDLYYKLKYLRDQNLKPSDWNKSLRRFLYLIAVYCTFLQPIYRWVNILERLGILDKFVQYYDEYKIDMPKDHLQMMSPLEARVGRINIERLEENINKRRAAAKYYFNYLEDKKFIKLPPQEIGATYSHFVIQVENRDRWIKKAIRKGIQLGILIEYCIPELSAYSKCHTNQYPVSASYAITLINLPVWGGESVAKKVVNKLFNH